MREDRRIYQNEGAFSHIAGLIYCGDDEEDDENEEEEEPEEEEPVSTAGCRIVTAIS